MAVQPPPSSSHSKYMDERARISDELARIKTTLLLKGLPPGVSRQEAFQDVSIHGRWDGIVGHPVEVNIRFLVWQTNYI